MRGRISEAPPAWLRSTALALFTGSVALILGFEYIAHRLVVLGVVGTSIVLALLALRPSAVALLALPGVWLAKQRLGGALALADALLLLGAAIALAVGAGRQLTWAARRLLVFFGLYLGLCSVAVAFHPTPQGGIELVHRIILVGGGVLVGGWLVHEGLLSLGLRLLAGVAVFFAVISMADGATGHPAYPLGYHKNFAGSLFAICILLLLIAPKEFRFSRSWTTRVLLGVIAGGLIATQSRGSLIGTALGGTIWYFRTLRGSQGRVGRVVSLIAFATLAYIAVTSIQDQLTAQKEGAVQIDSLTQRTMVEQETRALWRSHPLAGVGLRFFNTPEYPTYQAPNNVFDEALAESGVLGTAGLALLVVGSVTILWRVRTPLGIAGTAVLADSWFHAQIDIYWANGQSLTWLVAGAALATAVAPKAPGTPSFKNRSSSLTIAAT